MAIGAGRLDVFLGLDAAEFTKGLSKAELATLRFQKNLEKNFSQLGTTIKGILGVITVKQIVDGFLAITNSLDDLDEAAQGLGTTAVALAEFRKSASESGVSAEQFDGALTKLSVKLTDAASGGKESAAVFAAMGISVRNSSGQLKTTEELLGAVADKFQGYRDGAEKTALAVELFGRSGAKLIPFLNQGADGLRKFAGVTDENVEAAKKLQAQFDQISSSLKELGISIASGLMPFLTKMVEEFLAANRAAGSLFGTIKLLGKQSAETLEDPGKKIGELTEQLSKLRAERDLFESGVKQSSLFGLADNREEIDALERELKFLKEIQRNRALTNAGNPYSNEGRIAGMTAPIPTRPGSGKREKEAIDENTQAYARYVEQLDQAVRREEKLTKVQEVNRAINEGRFGELIPQQKEVLLFLAQAADAQDEYNRKIAHNAELEREIAAAMTERKQRLDDLTGRSVAKRDLEDLKLLDEALRDNIISLEEFIAATDKIAGFDKDLEKATDAAEELGLTFSSALEDAIVDFNSLRDVLSGLEKDLIRIGTRKLVTEPLSNFMSDLFKGIGGGGGSFLSGLFGGQDLGGVFASGTDFVQRDMLAYVHRGERIIPAHENRGGVAASNSTSVVINLPPNTPGGAATANQVAAAVARQMALSNRRLN